MGKKKEKRSKRRRRKMKSKNEKQKEKKSKPLPTDFLFSLFTTDKSGLNCSPCPREKHIFFSLPFVTREGDDSKSFQRKVFFLLRVQMGF